MTHQTAENGKHSCGFWTWSNGVKVVIAIILFIMTIMIAPITENIRKTEDRVTRIERVELPAVKSEVAELKQDFREIKARQEAQLETLKDIAEDVKWLRRASERRNE